MFQTWKDKTEVHNSIKSSKIWLTDQGIGKTLYRGCVQVTSTLLSIKSLVIVYRMDKSAKLSNDLPLSTKQTNHKELTSQLANQNDTASSLMMEADIILDEGEGESDSLSLADIAEWALDSQQRNEQANIG